MSKSTMLPHTLRDPGSIEFILGPLPRSLVGSGEVEVVLIADGRSSNSVTVSIQ